MSADLTAWVDDAQYALDHAPVLTTDHIHALLATPDAPSRLRTGITWWIEEAARLMREDAFDARTPDAASAKERDARSARRLARVEELLALHADAMRRAIHAEAPAAPRQAPKRSASPDRALRAVTARRGTPTDSHPTQDSA